jgi:hypothetical protein
MRAALVHAWKLLGATLLQIFDESAYRRFLLRTNLKSSRHAYSRFRKEMEETGCRNPRCC